MVPVILNNSFMAVRKDLLISEVVTVEHYYKIEIIQNSF